MEIKEHLYNQCQIFLDDRLKVIKHTIKDIQNALQSETKSSAGDKHETGRAMLQLEREKAGFHLAEVQKLKEILNKINPETIHKTAALGSVVFTTNANYFIAISAGELEFENKKFFAISAATPIGQLLVSKQIGDNVKFRETLISIKAIV